MLLGTLGASLLGHMLTRKGILRAGYGNTKKISSNPSFQKFWNKKVL